MKRLIGLLLLIVGWSILFVTSNWKFATLIGGMAVELGIFLYERIV